MASDTASSIKRDGVSYRVSNNEEKIFEIGELTIFASGVKLIRDVFISLIDDSDNTDSIHDKLIKYILPSCGEFSLGVVVAKVERDYTSVVSFSSYNDFEKEESIVKDDLTKFFSAGIKTKEIYNSFEKNIERYPLLNALEKTYKENSCSEIGGNLQIFSLSYQNISKKEITIDNITPIEDSLNDPYISLIWGEYIFGKVISGVNLYIEDESGAWKTQGARTTIYKARTKNDDGTWSNPEEVMWLGLVSDNARDEFDNVIRQDSGECFGLKSWNSATMVELTNCVGFAISRWGNKYTPDGNYDWEKVLWADTSGTLYAMDLVTQNIKIRNNVGELMLDAEENMLNIGLFEDILADGKLTTLEKLQLITELHKIHRNYKNLLSQADKYIRSARDNATNVDGAFSTTTQTFGTVDSTTDRFSTAPLKQAYLDLMNYMSQYIKIINNGYGDYPLDIDVNDELTEKTSEVADRGVFISKFRVYHDEAQKLADAIEDSIFYSSIHMGEYYNNLVMNEFGFIAVRDDGMYRAYLNATNGLALERWENGRWVKKLYATLGDSTFPDGTLIAEGLITKNLKIWDADMNEKITFDWYDGITIYGDNGGIIYLNANDAIRIEVNGDDKFWVGMDGRLYAKDITTHNLKIVDGNLGEKIVFDENDGITIYGNNGGVIYLNANDAIRIAVNGDDKFWVGMDGRLYAKDITTHNLKIVDGNLGEKIIFDENDGITINGNNGEQIRLNANEGIAIDVNGDKRFWVGTDGNLYAKKLYIQGDDEMIVDVDGSYISDLTVNELKTLNSSSPQDFIHVKDNFIKMKTSYGGAEKDKFTLTVSGSGESAYPHMTWGAGGATSSDRNVAYQYKKGDGFYIDYIGADGKKHEFNMRSSDSAILLKTPNSINIDGENVNLKATKAITLEVGSNKLIINTSGITLNGTKINLN